MMDEMVPESVPEAGPPQISLSPGTGERAGERGNGIKLGRQLLAQFGFLAPNVPREIGLGLLLGVGAWGAVLVAAVVVGMIFLALGGEQAIPKEPPALIPYLAALPAGLRLMISLSAGVVEETFFRGFLQPRIGIALSTLLFVCAHFSYGQPLMLVGIGTLSLIYAFLVRWRQNIWPAIAAHALFDSVQLLVIIPMALRFMEKEGAKTVTFLLGN
jgi:membrane protease YdiL (CAAX protease family)